jgi:hypothetical protein
MTDPAADAARAAAEFFAAQYGPGLPAQVEAELAARDSDSERPGQYDLGLVLSAAALIVAIAQLAQSIYAMRHQQTAQPAPEAIARETRIELRKREISLTDQTLTITEFIATEITRRDLPSGDQG